MHDVLATRLDSSLFVMLLPINLVQQKNEELERAQRAVEEKSAAVKREKEALSNKQELETAQAAKEAVRNKKRAEEERQVCCSATLNTKCSHRTAPIPNYGPRALCLAVVQDLDVNGRLWYFLTIVVGPER